MGGEICKIQFNNVYKIKGYKTNVMRQITCLVVNTIMFDGYALLLNCMIVGQELRHNNSPNLNLSLANWCVMLSLTKPIVVQLCGSVCQCLQYLP